MFRVYNPRTGEEYISFPTQWAAIQYAAGLNRQGIPAYFTEQKDHPV